MDKEIPPTDGFIDPEEKTPYYEEPKAEKIELIDSSIDGSVFKVQGIGIASFLGSGVAGGLLLAYNYKKFKQKIMAYTAIFIGLLLTLISVMISQAFPVLGENNFSLASVVGLIQFGWAKFFMGDKIDELKRRNQTISNWVAAGVGFLLFLVITGIYVYLN